MHSVFEQLDAELAAVLSGLDTRQAQWTPPRHPEKWTIQQIVQHLILTYRSTVGVLESRIEKESPTKSKPSPQQRLGQFMLISVGYFPRGRRAPDAVSPGPPVSLQNGSELAGDLHDHLTMLDRTTERAQAMFGDGRCASHLVLGPLSVTQWRKFHLVHGHHHAKQIRRIRREHRS